MGINDAKELCEILEVPESAATCVSSIEKLNRKIKNHNNLKQTAALMPVAEIINPEKACSDVIAVDGARQFSTFYGLYMLDALSLTGMHNQAMQIISDYWGGMLDMGATTFWEDFNTERKVNSARLDEFTPEGKNDIHGDFGDYCYPGYRQSYCHGWDSGPTSWLTENVLGIIVVEPGCKTLKIEPHLGNLEWAEGSFPTPYGVVKVKHTKLKNGKIDSEIDAPKKVKIIRTKI